MGDHRGVRFHPRQIEAAQTALAFGRPVTWRITLMERRKVRLALTFDEWEPGLGTSPENGAVALDLSRGHVALSEVSGDGRVAGAARLPVEAGRATSEAIAKGAVARAKARGCPVALESLDFRRKKSWLKRYGKPFRVTTSRMKTTEVDQEVARAAARAGVEVVRVDPAWTARLGKLCHGTRTRLGGHHKAALVIGHRALGFSEKLPRGTPRRPGPTAVSGRGGAGRRISVRQWLPVSRRESGPRGSAAPPTSAVATGRPRAGAGPPRPSCGKGHGGSRQPACR